MKFFSFIHKERKPSQDPKLSELTQLEGLARKIGLQDLMDYCIKLAEAEKAHTPEFHLRNLEIKMKETTNKVIQNLIYCNPENQTYMLKCMQDTMSTFEFDSSSTISYRHKHLRAQCQKIINIFEVKAPSVEPTKPRCP